MSPVSHDTKAPSAAQEDRNNTGQSQGPAYDHSKAHQDIPSSAHEYHQQKRKDYPKGDQKRRYIRLPPIPFASILGLTLIRRQNTWPLTSQAMTRFEQQPHNNLEALHDRVIQYQTSSPVPGQHGKSVEEHQRQMADRMKAWSDEWKRLERK